MNGRFYGHLKCKSFHFNSFKTKIIFKLCSDEFERICFEVNLIFHLIMLEIEAVKEQGFFNSSTFSHFIPHTSTKDSIYLDLSTRFKIFFIFFISLIFLVRAFHNFAHSV
jgi:hypothetical protein